MYIPYDARGVDALISRWHPGRRQPMEACASRHRPVTTVSFWVWVLPSKECLGESPPLDAVASTHRTR